MGFLDFLFGRKQAKPGYTAQAQESADMGGPPPCYVFTYYMLRSIALSDPVSLLEIALNPAGIRELLAAILDDVEVYCGARVPFSADSIRVHCGTIGNSQSVVFELPEPQEVPEAYMVALVLSDGTGRYFSLERTFSAGDSPRAVLGEWDARAHHNHGGCEPTVAAFVAAISAMI